MDWISTHTSYMMMVYCIHGILHAKRCSVEAKYTVIFISECNSNPCVCVCVCVCVYVYTRGLCLCVCVCVCVCVCGPCLWGLLKDFDPAPMEKYPDEMCDVGQRPDVHTHTHTHKHTHTDTHTHTHTQAHTQTHTHKHTH